MTDATVKSALSEMGPAQFAWAILGVLAVLVGLLVLVYPGPLALADRVPMALILVLPGAFGLYHVYAEATSVL